MLLRNEFATLAERYGDEFRNSKIIIRDGFNGKDIYKGKTMATPKELLDKINIGISSHKNITVWILEQRGR